MWKTTPIRSHSASTSTITSLWFLSQCCSVNFCWNHCHSDKRCSKTACLLDLSRMKMLFIPHSPSFSLHSFLLQQHRGQRPRLPSISLLLMVTSYVDQNSARCYSRTQWAHKCTQFCLTITMSKFSTHIHLYYFYVHKTGMVREHLLQPFNNRCFQYKADVLTWPKWEQRGIFPKQNITLSITLQ